MRGLVAPAEDIPSPGPALRGRPDGADLAFAGGPPARLRWGSRTKRSKPSGISCRTTGWEGRSPTPIPVRGEPAARRPRARLPCRRWLQVPIRHCGFSASDAPNTEMPSALHDPASDLSPAVTTFALVLSKRDSNATRTDFTPGIRCSLLRPESARHRPLPAWIRCSFRSAPISRRRMLHERLLLPISNLSLPALSSSPDAPLFTASSELRARHEAWCVPPLGASLTSRDGVGSDRAAVDAASRASVSPSTSSFSRGLLSQAPWRRCFRKLPRGAALASTAGPGLSPGGPA